MQQSFESTCLSSTVFIIVSLLNICVVTSCANITYYERSRSVMKFKTAYHRAIIGLIT